MSTQVRKRKATAASRAAGVSALLVTHPADVRYLCGFTGSNGALVLGRGQPVLFTDGRYTEQAKAEAVGTRKVIAPPLKGVRAVACEWMESAGVTRCGFDAAHTSVAELDAMRKSVGTRLRRGFFQPLVAPIAVLREVKDRDEIAKLRAAAALTCRLFEEMLGVIEPGMTEMAVAAELEYRARKAGAEAMAFETIVASGARSALPHGRATGAKLPRRGFCTLDFGVVLNGYMSDMTRTVHLGRALPGEMAAYEAVLEAQEAAVAAVRPGAKAGEVDEAARSVLRRAGLEEFFTHSTGHGVGLEIHEAPRLGAEGKQVLREGMVVTIEPGVYLPERFGVRIEDMVLVTKRGGQVLTPSTKAWVQL